MFGDIKEVMWISKISLSTEIENNIRDCFLEQKVDFKHLMIYYNFAREKKHLVMNNV